MIKKKHAIMGITVVCTVIALIAIERPVKRNDWVFEPDGTNYVSSYLPCNVSIRDVVFIVMASASFPERHMNQRNTWMKDVSNIYAFADEAGPYTITLPEILHKSTYKDAQHRQLYGMKYLLSINVTGRWYFLVDDDTWVNVPRLVRFLTQVEAISDKTAVIGFREQTADYYNGGAGILLTYKGFQSITPRLYESCPFNQTNDNTITNCAKIAGNFTFIHSDLFLFYAKPMWLVWQFVEKITVHSLKDLATMQLMTEYARVHMAC